jgi:Ca-activated chloride channel family protein
VDVSPESAVKGEISTVTVSWTASTPRPANDWVALVPEGSPDTAFVSYAYTGGAQSGSVQLAAPMSNGTFRVKYFLQNSYTVGATGGTYTQVPDLPTPTVTIMPNTAEVGSGTLTFSFTATHNRHATDWVGFFPVGSSQLLWWSYTNGEAGGSTQVAVPEEPGDYELRYYEGSSTLLAVSNTLNVAEPGGIIVIATLANEPGTGNPSIRILWGAPSGSASTDWIGLYVQGASNHNYIRWFYTAGEESGDAYIPRPGSGTYELRYFLNNSFGHAATSNTVTVP